MYFNVSHRKQLVTDNNTVTKLGGILEEGVKGGYKWLPALPAQCLEGGLLALNCFYFHLFFVTFGLGATVVLLRTYSWLSAQGSVHTGLGLNWRWLPAE